MSSVALDPPIAEPVPAKVAPARSPYQRAWARFRRNRIGFISLVVFAAMVAVASLAEVVSNDRPMVARYEGKLYFPMFKNHPESTFGGTFETPTEWNDPLIRRNFAKPGKTARLIGCTRFVAGSIAIS